MPTYLWSATYTSDGAKGLIKEGAVQRRATVRRNIEESGGKLIAFYYAFGEADAYVIAEMPDEISAVAVSLAINASGVVHLRTTVLLSPEEVNAAIGKSAVYNPPGG